MLQFLFLFPSLHNISLTAIQLNWIHNKNHRVRYTTQYNTTNEKKNNNKRITKCKIIKIVHKNKFP